MKCHYKEGLGRLLSGYACILLLHRRIGSQPPVTSGPGDLMNSLDTTDIYLYAHTPTQTNARKYFFSSP